MGIIAERRRKRRAARLRKSLLVIAAGMGLLAMLAWAPAVRESLRGLTRGVQTFSQSAQLEMTLKEYDIYALQLAVFDSGERAAREQQRLQKQGVRCVIWQRERMRIVADAAFSREALNLDAARGNDAYVISDTLEAVSLRLSADAAQLEQAKRLLETPDHLMKELSERTTTLETLVKQTRILAQEALDAQMDNALYTQLAQSLINWSALMEKTLTQTQDAEARSYGAATMCLLCRELRQALIASSTASAQRTPSTAADVMPPA